MRRSGGAIVALASIVIGACDRSARSPEPEPRTRRRASASTATRAALLGEVARKIRRLFPKDGPLDIEWVLQGETVFIVQARPYVDR